MTTPWIPQGPAPQIFGLPLPLKLKGPKLTRASPHLINQVGGRPRFIGAGPVGLALPLKGGLVLKDRTGGHIILLALPGLGSMAAA